MGSTDDPKFPVTAGAFQPTLPIPTNPPFFPPSSAFVANFNPTGSATIWATFIGGTGNDSALAVATDAAGEVWVPGTTRSADFPNSGGFRTVASSWWR